jgi:hypothetical protein
MSIKILPRKTRENRGSTAAAVTSVGTVTSVTAAKGVVKTAYKLVECVCQTFAGTAEQILVGGATATVLLNYVAVASAVIVVNVVRTVAAASAISRGIVCITAATSVITISEHSFFSTFLIYSRNNLNTVYSSGSQEVLNTDRSL